MLGCKIESIFEVYSYDPNPASAKIVHNQI